MEKESRMSGMNEIFAPYRRVRQAMQRVEQEIAYASLVPGTKIPEPVSVSRWTKLIAKTFGR